jgi:hypothetical protein
VAVVIKNSELKTLNGKVTASVQNLSGPHRAALDSFLIADHPVDKLVKIILEDWKEFPGATPDAVRRMLFRYKKKMILPKQAKLAAKHSSNKGLQALVSELTLLEKRLDPVMELEDLVMQQKTRLLKMAQTEDKAPTLLEAQTKNIALMGQLLTQLANLQLEVGVLVRVPKKAQVTTFEISEEERRFIETAKTSDAQASLLSEVMAMLKDDGVIDVASREVEDD